MYGKIFEQIYDGSLRLNWKALVTFQQMIVLCDSEGVVDMTHESLHFRTGIPLEILKDGISQLESPDARSRSEANDGRRIIRLDDHRDWGWQLVNHKLYRDLSTKQEKNKRDKLKMREKRAAIRNKSKGVAMCSDASQAVNDVAHTDTDTDIDKDNKKKNIYKKKKTKSVQFPNDFILTKELKDYAVKKGIIEHYVKEVFEEFKNHHESKGSVMKSWNSAWYTWVQKAINFNSPYAKERILVE